METEALVNKKMLTCSKGLIQRRQTGKKSFSSLNISNPNANQRLVTLSCTDKTKKEEVKKKESLVFILTNWADWQVQIKRE